MTDRPSHLIIGGGVIGLCCAYYLAREGWKVTIIDRDASRRASCSFRNAGMVVPSHFIPLAAPGVITQGLKWMLNRKSPFYLRPRLDKELISWCWQFYRHSTQRHVENSQTLLRDISLESRALFDELSDELGFTLVRKGLVMLCQSEEGLHEEAEVAEAANRLGIKAEVCPPERVRELDPDVEMKVRGGVWFPQDAHLDPESFLSALRNAIVDSGGTFLDGEVKGFERRGGNIAAIRTTDGQEIEADEFTIAGGAWSPDIASQLDLHIPMQGGKGYSFTLPAPRQLPQLCSLLKEGRVAVTPMGNDLRVAGTMEICGQDLSIDQLRLQGIIESFCRFFPQFSAKDFEGLKPWSGLRPCTPDGLPYIGRVPNTANVTVATGHSMLGLSLGPVTGKMVAAICSGTAPDARLRPGRF